jgi:hypothetical protein
VHAGTAEVAAPTAAASRPALVIVVVVVLVVVMPPAALRIVGRLEAAGAAVSPALLVVLHGFVVLSLRLMCSPRLSREQLDSSTIYR